MKRSFLIFLLGLCVTVTRAQLSGTYSVPGSFTSVASAIGSLNVAGVTGPVTINIAAGYTETVATGGYSLYTVVGSSSVNTITFRKSGTGINPTLYSYTGTRQASEAIQDGMWRLIGADYIAIDGINLTDNKTTNPATMEFGFGLFKANGNDGCQHNQITNCVISLNRNNNLSSNGLGIAGSKGIEMIGAAPNTHTMAVTPLSADGGNSYNTFSANQIQNCNYGISLNSTYTISNSLLCDRGNTVGGALAANGNTIVNFGGGNNVLSAAGAVYFNGQFDLSISNNSVTSNNGSGALQTVSDIYGFQGKQNNYNLSITNNTLSVKGGSTCPNVYGISNQGISTFSAGSSVTISGNTFTSCTSQTSFYGIYNTCTTDSLLLSSNTFSRCTAAGATHTLSLIRNTGTVNNGLVMNNNLLSYSVQGTYYGNFSGLYNNAVSNSVVMGGNTFRNIIFGTGSANFTLNLIANTGTNTTLSVLNNSFLPISYVNSGVSTFISNTSITNSLVTVAGNAISGFTNSVAGNTIYCYYGVNSSPPASTVAIYSNTISNIQGYASYFYGFSSKESVAPFCSRKLVYNNTISDCRYFFSWIGFDLDRLGDSNGAGASAVYNNTVTNISIDAQCIGISTGPITGDFSAPPSIYANTINSLVCGASVLNYDCAGIDAIAGVAGLNIYRNKITNIATTNTRTAVGLKVISTTTVASAGDVNIYNNIIGHISSGSVTAMFYSNIGISASGTSHYKIYHNTVYLASTVPGGAACLALGSTADSRNNLLVNLSAGTAYYNRGVAISGADSYSLSNNNLFYAVPGLWNGLYSDGVNLYTTLPAFRTAVQGREMNSVTENVVFASTSWSNAAYLSADPTVPTQVESGGTPISWITTDFFGNSRNPNTPDIGAIEGNYLPATSDSLPPVFSNVAFTSPSCGPSVRTLTAQLSDVSGVASGSLSPAVYYSINSGTYSVSPGVLTSGSSTLGIYTFSLPYVAGYGDVISWFIIAQDASTLTNVGSWPAVGLVASSVNSISTMPTPLSYTVSMPLGGTYTVGAGGTFTSLGAAANAYNNACLYGPVTFVLTNSVYGLPGETFPIVFKNNAEASSTNYLLIVPAAGQTVAVTNGAQAATKSLIKFEDARYITLDGSTGSGSGLFLNAGTNPSSLSAVVWLASNDIVGAGSQYITIKDVDFSSTSNFESVGIVATGNRTLLTDYYPAGYHNDFITIDGNRFYALERAVYVAGYTDLSSGANTNWTITNNLVGPAVPSATGNIGFVGLYVEKTNVLSVLNNTVCNIFNVLSYYPPVGIDLNWGVSSATVAFNTIRSVTCNPSNAISPTGINLDTYNDNSDILLYNNMISDIRGLASTAPTSGLSVGSTVATGGVKIYNNTIAMTQSTSLTYTGSIYGSDIVISSCIRLGDQTNTEIKNNLLYTNVFNSGNAGSKTYCLYNDHGSPTPPAVFDYNNYYANSSQGFLMNNLFTNYATLSTLQAATSQNVHSTNLMPVFTSSVDVHLDGNSLNNLQLKNTGAPVSLYATDIDNEPRNTTAPDVGADEFVVTAACTTAIGGTVSPASYSICSTQTVAVFSSGASGGVGTTYQWQVSPTAGGTYTNLSTGTGVNSLNYDPAGQLPGGVYYLRLLTGCASASLTSASNEVTLTVIAPPTLSTTASSTALCSGASATLTATGAATYSWNTGQTTSSIVVTPTANASYFVTYGSAPCTFSTSSNIGIYVSQMPAVSVSSTPASICNGESATLTASGATSYSWSGGLSGATINATPSVTTVYTVTGYSNPGCGNTVTVSVAVNPLPTIGISGPTVTCSGQSLSLVASGADTYTWSNAANSSSIDVMPVSSTVYSVSGTSSAGCISSAMFSLAVTAPSTINVTGQMVLCSGDAATLTATGVSNFSWSTGATAPNIVITPTANTAYTVTAMGDCADPVVASVTVNPVPTLSVSGNLAICSGQTGSLSVSGANSYTWSTNSNSTDIAVSPTISSSYTVSGTSTGGCISNSLVSVAVNTVPVVSISPSTATICAFSAASLTASGADSYSWSSGASSSVAVVTPSASSVYSVVGTNSTGCSTSQTVAVNTNPLPVISVSPVSATVCEQSPVSFTASGAATYTWSGGVGTSSAVTFVASSNQYTVSGTDAVGCVGSQTVSVVTNSLPVMAISGSTALCAGQSETLTVTGANSYTWSNSSNATTIAVSPAANSTYSVSGTSVEGCVSGTMIAVVVNTLPVISVSPASATVCALSTISLTASGADSYSWSSGASSSVAIVTPSASSVYSVFGINSTGCSASQTVAVSTNSLPVISVSPASATVCEQSPVSFTASGAAAYSWSGGIGTSSTVSFVANSGQYTVSGTNAAGCTSNQTVSVVANLLPAVAISGPASLCAGQSATLTVTGASSYLWNTAATASSIVASPVSNTSYSVTGTDANGCSADAGFTITSSPLPAITLAVSPSVVCVLSSAILMASGADSYTWSPGMNTDSFVISPSQSTTYSVSGTNSAGCVAMQSISINPQALPVVTILPASATVCIQSLVSFTASGAGTYTWSNGNSGASTTFSPVSNSVYTVGGTDGTNGCVSTATVAVSTNSLPVISISGNQTLCVGESASLTASGASTYTWLPDNFSGNVFTPSLSASVTYTAMGTDANGCESAAEAVLIVDACTGLRTLTSTAWSIRISPNPSAGKFEVSGTVSGTKQITVIDNLGQLVYEANTSSESASIDLTQKAKGVYTVLIRSSEGIKQAKVIID